MSTNREIFFGDKNIETAMIKSCLLLDKFRINNRDVYFQKRLLAHIFTSDISCIDDAYDLICKKYPSYSFDKNKLISNLEKLEKKGVVIIDDDGKVRLTQKTCEEGTKFLSKHNSSLDKLVNDIYVSVESNFNVLRYKNQIIENIKECLNYYIRISCYNILGIDDDSDGLGSDRIKSLAGRNINENRIVEQIILSIGNVIDHPSDGQRQTIEYIARVVLLTRLTGIDPFLNNFKNSVIGQKSFILDTDILLYLITDDGEISREYKALFQTLLRCGCQIYIPSEVLEEVYDHAEAATKRYHFVDGLARQRGQDWAKENVRNIFLESYYHLVKTKNNNLKWSKYISNYFDDQYGLEFTIAAIKEFLGNDHHIHLGLMPQKADIFQSNDTADISLRDNLLDKAIEDSRFAIKAEFRDEGKSLQVAKTDTMLYLTILKLNKQERQRNGLISQRADLLDHKYYLLTAFFRLYKTAKEMGLNDKISCTPSALMAYLAESGILDNKNLNISNLFDNPFLAYIAKSSWNDAEKILKAGIDISGKNIVRLRYDLQKEVHQLITSEIGTDSYNEAYESTIQKGYSFDKHVEYAKNIEEKLKEKDAQINYLQEQLEKRKRQDSKKQYEQRIKARLQNSKKQK